LVPGTERWSAQSREGGTLCRGLARGRKRKKETRVQVTRRVKKKMGDEWDVFGKAERWGLPTGNKESSNLQKKKKGGTGLLRSRKQIERTWFLDRR